MAAQLAEELSFCHSERSLQSEDLGPIARLLCDEALFSWVLAKTISRFARNDAQGALDACAFLRQGNPLLFSLLSY
jgi:hypothetical protein